MDTHPSAEVRTLSIRRGEEVQTARPTAGRKAHVFFLHRALLAVVCVGHPETAADDASPGVRSIVALVAYSDECCGSHIRIADDTLPVTCTIEIGSGSMRPTYIYTSVSPGVNVLRADNVPRHGRPLRTFLAEAPNCDAGQLAAHDEIGMMLRHGYGRRGSLTE